MRSKIRILAAFAFSAALILCLGQGQGAMAAGATSSSSPTTGTITLDELANLPIGTATAIGTDARSRSYILCELFTGNVYSRTSGSGYAFGSIGFKPKTSCTSPVISIHHRAEVDKYAFLGFPFTVQQFGNSSYGVASLETKSIEVICADYRSTTFIGVVYSTVTFPNGNIVTMAAKTNDATIACGTNP